MPSVTSLQGQRLWLVWGGNSAREESTDHLPLGCWTAWSPYGVGWAGAASPYRQRASEGTRSGCTLGLARRGQLSR